MNPASSASAAPMASPILGAALAEAIVKSTPMMTPPAVWPVSLIAEAPRPCRQQRSNRGEPSPPGKPLIGRRNERRRHTMFDVLGG